MMTILCADENLCDECEMCSRLVPAFEDLLEVGEHFGIHLVFVECLCSPPAYAFSLLVSSFTPSADVEEEPVVVLVDERRVCFLTSANKIGDCFLDVADVMKVELDHLRCARVMIDGCVDLRLTRSASGWWCPFSHGDCLRVGVIRARAA